EARLLRSRCITTLSIGRQWAGLSGNHRNMGVGRRLPWENLTGQPPAAAVAAENALKETAARVIRRSQPGTITITRTRSERRIPSPEYLSQQPTAAVRTLRPTEEFGVGTPKMDSITRASERPAVGLAPNMSGHSTAQSSTSRTTL